MKNKTKKKAGWWIAIIVVAFIDVFATTLVGLFPALGDALAGVSNMIWEIIQLGLVFGLVSSTAKK
jgi:hypothetical protein